MKKTKIQNIILYFINFILIGFIILSNKGFILNNTRITLKKMNESTQITDLNKTIEELNNSHTDYSNYIQTSKTAIATALTNEGVVTSNEDTFETITTNIGKVLQARTSNATATADNISKGKTAWVNGELVVGNGSDSVDYYSDYSSMIPIMHASTARSISETYKCSRDTTALIALAGNQYDASGNITINGDVIYSYNSSQWEVPSLIQNIELKKGDTITININTGTVSAAYGVCCLLFHNGGIY